MTTPTNEELSPWMREHKIRCGFDYSMPSEEQWFACVWGVQGPSGQGCSMLEALHALAKAKGLPWKWEEKG